jgi:hypothetical protein
MDQKRHDSLGPLNGSPAAKCNASWLNGPSVSLDVISARFNELAQHTAELAVQAELATYTTVSLPSLVLLEINPLDLYDPLVIR